MPDVPPVRRRTALAGALGSVAATVLAAGCDHGDDIGSPPASSGPSATSHSSPPSSAPAETPDEALVDSTIEQLNVAVGVLVAARRFPALRRPLAPLVRAHRRHVEVLEGGDLLEPPSPEEAELLGLLGGCGEHRLACQARVKPGAGVVRLRAVLGG